MERSSADEITGNSVKLLGNTNVKGTVYGAFGGSDDSITAYNQGNFIEAQGVHNNVNLIDGFETLKLTVGNENLSTIDEGKNGDKAVLTVGASSAGDTEKHTISFSDRKIELSSAESFSPETGYLNLIHVDGPNVAVALPEASVITWNDTFINTEWELTDNQLTYENGDTLTLSITKEESEPEPTPTPGDEDDEDQGGNKPIKPTDQYANSNAQTLSRASLGAAALIGTSLEYIADEGINIFNDAAKAHPDGINAFAAVYGSTNNYDGNANFDLDTVTAITGVTTRRNDAVIAAFIEAGRGWEDSDIGSAHTDAEYKLYDVGAAVRFLFDNPTYIDASLRVGVVQTDFNGNYPSESVSYNTNRLFQAAHLTAGYDIPLSEYLSLDTYGRYTYLHIEGDEVNLHDRNSSNFELDDINYNAFRIGSRLKGYFGENQIGNYRLGIAYEKVTDGSSHAKINGLDIDAPDLKGDIGILEVGIAKRPTNDSPWGVDFTAKGYGGDREGIHGSATFNYVFF